MNDRASALTNIVIAGLGGQGVLRASDIVADTAFRAGYDVKKSEIHGMSQRGGSVTSDVRIGHDVKSPMVPDGEADYLVVLDPTQIAPSRSVLRIGGTLVGCDLIDAATLGNRRSMNVALLGMLSRYLDIDEAHWLHAVRANLPRTAHEVNIQAFGLGREAEGPPGR